MAPCTFPTQVTLSYLGKLLTAPLAERQAELKEKWGFDCRCQRWVGCCMSGSCGLPLLEAGWDIPSCCDVCL